MIITQNNKLEWEIIVNPDVRIFLRYKYDSEWWSIRVQVHKWNSSWLYDFSPTKTIQQMLNNINNSYSQFGGLTPVGIEVKNCLEKLKFTVESTKL